MVAMAGAPSRPTVLGSLSSHRPEARVVAEVEVDVPTERAIPLQSRPSTTARPVSVVVALPGELDARALPRRPGSTIHVSLDGDEPEVAGSIRAELDEAWLDEVDVLHVPEVHLRDSPSAHQAHCS